MKINDRFGPSIHTKRKNVRPRVVPDDVKIEFATSDLVEIQLRSENPFATSQRTGEYLTQR